MTDAPEEQDLVARGRAIFDQLRGGIAAPPEVLEGEPENGGRDDGAPDALADRGPDVLAGLDVADEEVDHLEPTLGTGPPLFPPPLPATVPDASPAGNLLAPPVGAAPPDVDLAEGTPDLDPLATGDHEIGTVEPSPPVATAPVTPPAPPPSPFARDLPRVIAIANQKGGVGKTTTAINLSSCLAELGYRVLVVDLDPQGNATTGLGINPRNLAASMYDVLLSDRGLDDAIEATSVRNLFVAPSSLDLAGAEIELVPAFSRELKLRRAVEEIIEDFDFVIVDCPPSLGLLTVNGLAAAAEVLVPIQCEYYALEGLGQLLRNVGMVQQNLNPRLEVSAIVLVMYDARTKLSGEVVNEVRGYFGEKVCRTIVPRTVRLSEAPSFGQPINAFDPSSRGAIAYRELAKEISGGTPHRAG